VPAPDRRLPAALMQRFDVDEALIGDVFEESKHRCRMWL
jgi:hypothetical protein